MDPQDISNRFAFHAAPADSKRLMHATREACGNAAHAINELCPDGREKALAITALEQAMFWSSAALARPAVPAGVPR